MMLGRRLTTVLGLGWGAGGGGACQKPDRRLEFSQSPAIYISYYRIYSPGSAFSLSTRAQRMLLL